MREKCRVAEKEEQNHRFDDSDGSDEDYVEKVDMVAVAKIRVLHG